MTEQSSGPPTDEAAQSLGEHLHGLHQDLNIKHGEGPVADKADDRAPHDAFERVERLQETTEIEFIRRETRFIPVMMNMWTHFSLFGSGRKSPRSRAALSAFLWRVFSPGAAAAAAGGAAVVLLGVAQVMLVVQQNAKLDQQTHIMQSQTNVTLLSQMGPILERILAYAQETCLRSVGEAATPQSQRIDPKLFGVDEKPPLSDLPHCWIDVRPEHRRLWILECSASPYCLDRVRMTSPSFRSLEQRRESVGEEPIESVLPLPAGIHGQVVSLSLSARPYRFIETSVVLHPQSVDEADRETTLRRWWSEVLQENVPRLVSRPLSPERGTLLSIYLRLGLQQTQEALGRPDFSDAYVSGVEARDFVGDGAFHRVSLPNSIFSRARFGFTAVWSSDFHCSTFEGADLSNAAIRGGDFAGAYFRHALLPLSENFSPDDLTKAYLQGAVVRQKDFLDTLSKRRTKGFDGKKYRLLEHKDVKGAYEIAFREGLSADDVMGTNLCGEAAAGVQ